MLKLTSLMVLSAMIATQGHAMAAPDRESVRAALAKRREHNLDSFRAYRNGGVYPHNFVRPGPLNTWRDRDGHLCAAATMIDRDGKHELVAETARTNNQIRLLNVTDGAMMDWILTSGFTLEEIDRIQEPGFQPEMPPPPPADWQAQEDARLKKDYAATDAWLVKHGKDGLDSATTRLMAHPELAEKLLAGET